MEENYLDYAAATPLDTEVYAAMKLFFEVLYANPLSIHSSGIITRKALETARSVVSKNLSANPDEIIFTSGATEACNLAISGVAYANANQGKHLITTLIEHHAGLEPFKHLEKEGFEVTYIQPGKNGVVKSEDVIAAIRPDTILISVILANNETGAIQPISEIGNIVEKKRQKNNSKTPLFHTDASAALNYIDPNVKKLHVDLLSFGAGKIYGPIGVGTLFIRQGIEVKPLMFGGGPKGSVRPGTPYVAGAVGLAKALEIVKSKRNIDSDRISLLRNRLAEGIKKNFPEVIINSDLNFTLPGHLNLSFSGLDGEALVLYLDAEGIRVSNGAACSSSDLEPSQTLIAMNRTKEQALGAVRFTLGRQTTNKQIEQVLKVLPKVIEKLKYV